MTNQKHKTGRLFNTVQEFRDKINSYLEYCKEHDVPVLMLGFCVYCGIRVHSFASYKNYTEYSELYQYLKNACHIDLLTGGLSGKYNTQMTIMLLCSNYGYHR